MESLIWNEVKDSGVFWTKDERSHSFILKFPSNHPSALTIRFLDDIGSYNALAKRLEIYAKFCSPKWVSYIYTKCGKYLRIYIINHYNNIL